MTKLLASIFSLACRAGIVGIFSAASAAAIASDQPPVLVGVPFVGCKADGQTGPLAAPTRGRTPMVPAQAAARLAYYEFARFAVLAPRGWHCFGLYGSDGSTLLVTPERHNSADLFRSKTNIRGPAVQLSLSLGDTSGRFEVATVAARIFPVAAPFVRQVIDEGLVPEKDFIWGPYPNDRLVRRSDTVVEFVTPADSEGLGTNSRLAKNGDPISGVAILLPEEDMNLISLSVRLPPDLLELAPLIISSTEQTHGKLLGGKSD